METILISFLPFLAFFVILLVYALRRVPCPDCGETLPSIYSPSQKTSRMWRSGGYLCAHCGCETDMAGRRVTADTPLDRSPKLLLLLLVILVLAGLAFGSAVSYFQLREALPQAAVPQVAPAVAPMN